ncbi:MAG: endonuclease/exonuclease/phosphatase family protein [Candidatus Thorarchaeota archaeon]
MSTTIHRHWKTILPFILLLIPLLFIVGWGSFTYNITPQPSGQLTVMSYNIHEAFDITNRLDLDAILQTIQQADPDILVLQEVDTGVIMSGSTDQSRWLALKLNMYLAPVTSTNHIWQSDVILSKYPILNYDYLLLPSPSEDDTLLRAEINIDGQQVSVYAVHFSAFSSADRQIQADIGIPWVMDTAGLKIWAGDFNVNAYSNDSVDQSIYADITTYLNDSFTVAVSQAGNQTWPSWDPYERIDYVFVSSTITVISHTVPVSYASDHLPVVVELQLPSLPISQQANQMADLMQLDDMESCVSILRNRKHI